MPITRHDVGPRMSRAVVHGDTLYLSGHVHPDRSIGVAGQTKAILERIEALLKEVGSDKSKLLSANIWLSDIAKFDEMNAVWERWIDPANPPARATVQATLASPDYLVEVAVIAAR